ncbi:MAG TPA: hypothetical protein VFC78_05765 [Tepidisphaeraceae bacterium]|nr:hypothetical protein [Tepidisphaeraceae bacterium]
MTRILSIVSLLLSLAALCLAMAAYRGADKRAAAAVGAREEAMVNHLKPRLDRLYRDFGTNLSPAQRDPRTLEDLLAPLLQSLEPIATRPTPAEVGPNPKK